MSPYTRIVVRWPGVVIQTSLFVLMIWCHQPDATLTTNIEGCDPSIDLVFIVDASLSVTNSDPIGHEGATWSAIKNFISGVMQYFPVGQATKVATVRYGTKADMVFHLDEHKSLAEADDAVRVMTHLGGNTNTAAALRLGRTSGFTGTYGARASARNIVVFIGDGVSNLETENIAKEARRLKVESDVEVFTVGVSREIWPEELRMLASEPSATHFLHAVTLGDLEIVKQFLVRRMCKLPDPTNIQPPQPACSSSPACDLCDGELCFACEDGKFLANGKCHDCLANCVKCSDGDTCSKCADGWFWHAELRKCEECEIVADLALLVDNSGSIRDKNPSDGSYDNYELLKEFLSRLLDRMDVGANVTRVGAIRFSSTSHLVFHLNTYSARPLMQKQIHAMAFENGHTNISGALRMMRTELFTESHGDRPDARNMAIILTDGQSTKATNMTLQEAQQAKEQGITLFVVGITDEINVEELQTIASAPLSEHYFNSTDIRSLDDLLGTLIKQVCTPSVLTEEAP